MTVGQTPSLNVETNLIYRMIKTPQECQEASDLLDRAFPVLEGQHFLDDFPIWDSQFAASKVLLGAYSNNRLVACAGARVAALKTTNKSLKLGLIGAVATDSAWRSKGIATELVAALSSVLEQQKVDLIVLWGSEHSLYQKLGFELCGEQSRIAITQFQVSSASLPMAGIRVHEGLSVELEQKLLGLIQTRPLGIQPQATDLAWLKAHKNVNWIWAEVNKEPIAFAAHGRGIDLQNIVHEWGGDPHALKAIFNYLAMKNPKLELLGNFSVYEAAQIKHTRKNLEFLCLAKVVNPQAVALAYHPDWAGKFEVNEKGDWKVSLGGESVENLSQNSLAVLLFGPEKFEGPWEQAFPLPLWIWGLDAV